MQAEKSDEHVPINFCCCFLFLFWSWTRTIDSEFERLDLSVNPYLEKNLEYLCLFVDDIIQVIFALLVTLCVGFLDFRSCCGSEGLLVCYIFSFAHKRNTTKFEIMKDN